MKGKEVFTERMMLDRLNTRYGVAVQNGSWRGFRFTRAEQVPTSPNRWGGHRVADFIAIDQYSAPHKELTEYEKTVLADSWGKRQSIHVFEVKVSRADLKHELDDLSKSEEWGQYAHYFWLVVSDLSYLKGQTLPEHWGVLYPYGRGLRVHRFPVRRDPAPMPFHVVAALARAVAKTESGLAVRLTNDATKVEV